eukprot:gene4302-2292_t
MVYLNSQFDRGCLVPLIEDGFKEKQEIYWHPLLQSLIKQFLYFIGAASLCANKDRYYYKTRKELRDYKSRGNGAELYDALKSADRRHAELAGTVTAHVNRAATQQASTDPMPRKEKMSKPDDPPSLIPEVGRHFSWRCQKCRRPNYPEASLHAFRLIRIYDNEQ